MTRMRLHPPSTRYRPRSQRGAGAVMMMLLLASLVAILGLVEVGYLYWAKREVQKVADLAALAGAQQLKLCESANNTDNAAARSNAFEENGFIGTLLIRCGNWAADNPTEDHFLDTLDGDHPLNAVKVIAQRPSIPFFGQVGSMPMIGATAIAQRSVPQAAFSVGSGLLNVNSDALLQLLLKELGADLSNTQIASYKGLAKVNITPRALLQALGVPVNADITVGQLNSLLSDTRISVGKLLELAADAAGAQGFIDVKLGLLELARVHTVLEDAEVLLGSIADSSGLFASIVAGSHTASSALDVEVNALDLLGTSIAIANGKNAVAIEQLNLLGIKAKASIVEPASIAIGPVGTTAYNSQVRLFLDIDTDHLPLGLGAVLKLLGTRIKLPTYIDVVNGFGELADIDCSVRPAQAKVDVVSSVANICIGKPGTPWDSTREICSTGLGNEKLVTLLGATVLEHKITLPALRAYDQLTLEAGQTGTVAPNDLELGTLVSDLVTELLGTLGKLFTSNGSASDTARNLATSYLEATANNGRFQPAAVINALRDGHGELPALGDWDTTIPDCQWALLICVPVKKQGSVWLGFERETGITDASVLGGLLQVLGITACDGLLTQLLRYNNCVRDALAKYLQTRPGGLQGMGSYDPVNGTGSCSGILCMLLKPVVDATLRPLLNAVGNLLSRTLGDVLGLELGRTDVHMHSIQCNAAQLVY